jgi:hypothetical protein
MVDLKLMINGTASYEVVKEFCEFGISKGYEVIFVDNGNIVFEKGQQNKSKDNSVDIGLDKQVLTGSADTRKGSEETKR